MMLIWKIYQDLIKDFLQLVLLKVFVFIHILFKLIILESYKNKEVESPLLNRGRSRTISFDVFNKGTVH